MDWTTRTPFTSDRNGTTTHSVAFATPAPGSLLVAIGSSPSPSNTSAEPAGWTRRAAAGSNSGQTIWTRDAVGDEAGLDIVLMHPDWELTGVVYEYPAGTTWGDFAKQDEASNPGPALPDIPAGATVMLSVALGVSGTPAATPNPSISSPAGFAVDVEHYYPAGGSPSHDGTGIVTLYDHDYAASSFTPEFIFQDSTNLGGAIGQSRIAFWLSPPPPSELDTPMVTLVGTTKADPAGSSTGTITISFTAVEGAGDYAAALAVGHGATADEDFDLLVDLDATSPHTFVGVPAGAYTCGVIAMPPEV
jgi:hypothetical protein